MKHPPYSGNAQIDASRLETLISDLSHLVQLLSHDIERYRETARATGSTRFAYPIAVRTMTARRDNLILTVAALERRLSESKHAVAAVR
ncbi:hypothetical protein [Bradyrhizobium archetypum]|uniref:Uncharacterized protein n=1 Tax=Bradyrhizobium archetypum TaxID=2721160 RepID=A0A7Y4M354_9BRAD|nr:hypothetical protein [Bradyrhizobium archetypum]NOJ47670.1 hypothetical protein [Bradyrhizobium archetypum]